jgi:hypothetical protein
MPQEIERIEGIVAARFGIPANKKGDTGVPPFYCDYLIWSRVFVIYSPDELKKFQPVQSQIAIRIVSKTVPGKPGFRQHPEWSDTGCRCADNDRFGDV